MCEIYNTAYIILGVLAALTIFSRARHSKSGNAILGTSAGISAIVLVLVLSIRKLIDINAPDITALILIYAVLALGSFVTYRYLIRK